MQNQSQVPVRVAQPGQRDIIEIPQDKVALVAKETGLMVEQVHPFVVAYTDGKGGMRPYITTPGKRFKMDERFGAGGYDVKTMLPTEQEYDFLCRMMGVKKDSPYIIIKCEIWVDGKLKYSDYGTASPENMYPDLFRKRGLEIATTRAINRAMDQGIAKGFSDVSKKYEHSLFGYKLDFVKTCQDYKKKLGDEQYYAIMLQYGVQHSNDPNLTNDPLMMEMVINDMEKALGGTPEHEKEMALDDAIEAVYGPDSNGKQAEPEVETKGVSVKEDLLFEIGEAVKRGRLKDEEADNAQRLINEGKIDENTMREKADKLKEEREKAVIGAI